MSPNHASIHAAFELLDSLGLRYFLLRPVDLNEEVKDLDIVMPPQHVQQLIAFLQASGVEGKTTTSIAENSIGIWVGDVLLDIKTRLCFFPSKFLAFDQPPTWTKVRHLNPDTLIADADPDEQFAYWMLHLFLDKMRPYDSSSFHVFKVLYEDDWQQRLHSPICQTWMKRIWGRFFPEALTALEAFFENGFNHPPGSDNSYLQNLVLSRNPRIHLLYHFERIKYGLLRRIKRNLYQPLAAYAG